MHTTLHTHRRRRGHTCGAVRLWNALIYHIVIALLCIIMHAAAGDAGDRDLRGAGDVAMMLRLAPNQVARGGGQGLPAVAEPIRGMGPGAHAPSWSR